MQEEQSGVSGPGGDGKEKLGQRHLIPCPDPVVGTDDQGKREDEDPGKEQAPVDLIELNDRGKDGEQTGKALGSQAMILQQIHRGGEK